MDENIQGLPKEETRKKKILIVDDEPDMVYSLKLTIENAGHKTVVASNGQQGLEKIGQERPDLIIADVLMPVMDGFKFYKRLKKSKATSNIPVIILTARGQMEDAFKVVGVDAFFAKPFENDILLSKIEELLRKAAQLKNRDEDEAGPKRILVAGAYTEVVENMVMQLREHDYETDFVLSGPEAITQSAVFKPHIMILDIQMEGVDSQEIIRILRLLPEFKKMPILLYSYYRLAEMGVEGNESRPTKKMRSIESYTDECLEAGATEYLGKFQEASFFDAVREYL